MAVASSATLLGFSDATNYYFNLNVDKRNEYLNTVFFLQFLIGLTCAIIILLGNRIITGYFDNPQLSGLYIYFAFRPMLSNMVISLQPLQTAVGKARTIAFWNVVVMLFKLLMVLATAYLTQDVLTVFISLLIVDVVTVAYYARNFKKHAFRIRLFKFDSKLIKEILQFCIPMGIYILANSLMKDTDKLIIGYYETPEALAVYSNCSAQLPVGIIATAFLTVVLPMITKSVQSSDNLRAQELCRAYLKMGYLSTTILGMACIVLAPEAIRLLYGEKYLAGKGVFIAYIVVDIIKFANTTIVLTAKGRTKVLMKISIISLIINAILNVIMYSMMGFIGPAIATVAISIATTYLLLKLTAETIDSKISLLLDIKCILKLALSIAAASCVAVVFRSRLIELDVNFFVILAVIGVLYCGSLFTANYKELKKTLEVL